MSKKAVILCALLSASLLFCACGNKNKTGEKAATPSPSPTATAVQTQEPASDTGSSSVGFQGEYDVKEEGNNVNVTITPKEGTSDIAQTNVTYSFDGDAVNGVSYKTDYKDEAAAKTAYNKMKDDASFDKVKLSGATVTYDISGSALELYKGMTRQDIIALTEALNGKTSE